MMTQIRTRTQALETWRDFLPQVRRYAAQRNHVETGHKNVSRLSAALRYRVITEDEIIAETLEHHRLSTVEKWLQEICWRRYWKGWLEMRPGVWTSWEARVQELRQTLPKDLLEKATVVSSGNSGVGCMDAIARELIETGYLHNHARMWWASFWIHSEQLPWELGADFFYQNLLDADAASNTLSWRWVAGLQTRGKTYMVRSSNIEKYAPQLLREHPHGNDRIADGLVKPCIPAEHADLTKQSLPVYPSEVVNVSDRTGLWLHTDDLVPEIGPLANLKLVAIAAFFSTEDLDEKRRVMEQAALNDSIARSSAHYHCPSEVFITTDKAKSLSSWAQSHDLKEVIGFAPFVGPEQKCLAQIREHLASLGIRFTLLRRETDAHAFSFSGSGFFPFWEKMKRHLSP
ncbi:MAG: DNA photolyase [Akkermansiaceae bacterium]|nr:DNA photolyase [Akkermansiaceae bacterium]